MVSTLPRSTLSRLVSKPLGGASGTFGVSARAGPLSSTTTAAARSRRFMIGYLTVGMTGKTTRGIFADDSAGVNEIARRTAVVGSCAAVTELVQWRDSRPAK